MAVGVGPGLALGVGVGVGLWLILGVAVGLGIGARVMVRGRTSVRSSWRVSGRGRFRAWVRVGITLDVMVWLGVGLVVRG